MLDSGFIFALFTSIPVGEAIQVIRGWLEKNTSLSERCELSIDQVITLLELFCNTTYFVCDSIFYCQICGTPMVLPISPDAANLVMEDLAEKVLDSAPTKQHVWSHYVDDTFMVLHTYDIQDFADHINSQSEHIKFTIEAEQDGHLAFNDTLVIVNDDGTLKTKIYRKLTNTDQYLNWDSNHRQKHKRSVVSTVLCRTERVVLGPEDVKEEVKHVKRC